MFEQREVDSALPWLHGKLHLDESFNLYYLIGNLRLGKQHLYYKKWEKRNKDGSFRPIYVPQGELRLVQKAINERILSGFCRPPQSYGWMGGNCLQAASEHIGFQSLLTFDVCHAFSSIRHYAVFQALRGLTPPYLSHYCSRFVADLCTIGDISEIDVSGEEWRSFGGCLPQGACTSPRLFELCVSGLDARLQVWAERLGLVYNRYADNLFFSSQEPEFPDFARAVVLSEARKQFQIHKIRQTKQGRMCRMLGLNLTSKQVSNTRAFKRALRGALHHLEYAIENQLDCEPAWRVVRGYMGFAVKGVVPADLLEKYEVLRDRVNLWTLGY